MDTAKFINDKTTSANTDVLENVPARRVFQPIKLTEIVDMIDLMGSISERVRTDSSRTSNGLAIAQNDQSSSQTKSMRDHAIANLPALQVMQEKLIRHLNKEITLVNRQIRTASRSSAQGSACLLNELYKMMRRLYTLIDELLQTSVDIVKRFYIAVFIDRQPILLSDNQSAGR